MKILIVLTSHDRLGGTGKKMGFWLGELAASYHVFKDTGAELHGAAKCDRNMSILLPASNKSILYQ